MPRAESARPRGGSRWRRPASWRSPWDPILLVLFSVVSGWGVVIAIYEPLLVGSHAVVYTDAAAAWLAGGDPWSVGPPNVIYAGPPTMLVPFVPFVAVPGLVTRLVWVIGMAALAVWVLRRLGLPGYWIVFPPISQAIILGHLEIAILWLLVAGGPASGLAMLMKPYAAAALVAERRWVALAIAAIVLVVTAPLLPWGRFIDQAPEIVESIRRQTADSGVSVFGSPVLMIVAIACLVPLGRRRALWLAAPLLWPSTQFLYKTVAVPHLSPLIAAFWAVPIPGATLLGVIADAAVRALGRYRPLPAWLAAALEPSARPIDPQRSESSA